MNISPMERLFRDCVKNVERRHGNYVRNLVGVTLYSALLSEEVFVLCCAQDDSVSPERVVEIMRYCNDRIIDLTVEPHPWDEAEVAP